ncbi:OmpA family protein [Solitalea koreensis]|uniref:Chemotaxis protein MotB n=1 Tax=Solitalea koreensis TaxID=543615 RepID=A0A521AVJ1_9SPHI|nr:OmpA family protein [Solitalea koreensis]SMO38858.1 chemotaxis protein MotB [Solitalea koreensis]
MIKKYSLPAFVVATMFSVSSCVVMNKKDYKHLLNDRDSLQNALNSCGISKDSLNAIAFNLKKDTSDLGKQLRMAQDQNDLLSENYNKLNNKSTGEIRKLSADLVAREKRLNEVEAVLKIRDEANNALKDKLAKALLGFRESGLTVDVKNGKVYVSLTDKLLFDTGSIIIDNKGKEALSELAKVLSTQPDINILVEGNTDNARVVNLGQIKDNWDLSVLRATSVVRYLTEVHKLEATRVEAAGKGEFAPIAIENTPAARSKNRRIEIVLSPKLDELFQMITENK